MPVALSSAPDWRWAPVVTPGAFPMESFTAGAVGAAVRTASGESFIVESGSAFVARLDAERGDQWENDEGKCGKRGSDTHFVLVEGLSRDGCKFSWKVVGGNGSFLEELLKGLLLLVFLSGVMRVRGIPTFFIQYIFLRVHRGELGTIKRNLGQLFVI